MYVISSESNTIRPASIALLIRIHYFNEDDSFVGINSPSSGVAKDSTTITIKI